MGASQVREERWALHVCRRCKVALALDGHAPNYGRCMGGCGERDRVEVMPVSEHEEALHAAIDRAKEYLDAARQEHEEKLKRVEGERDEWKSGAHREYKRVDELKAELAALQLDQHDVVRAAVSGALAALPPTPEEPESLVPDRRCGCSPGVTQVECPYHGGAI